MKAIFLAVLLLVGVSSISVGQMVLTKEQTQVIDNLVLQDVPKGAPGMATAIIQKGKVIYSRYAGFANLEDSIKIGPNTRFNLASNGKQFTALAILTLIQDKKLKLTDDIRKWFPELFPAINEEIRVEHLLTHTSGIRDCYDLWSLQGYTWWEKSFSNPDVLELVSRQVDLNAKPGSRYLYSNTNYILLALLVEKVSSISFVSYCNQMFVRLGMPNTSFENDYTRIRGSIAKPYFNFSTWSTYSWIWNVVGDGNFFSTLEDQITWEKIVQGFAPELASGIARGVLPRSQQLVSETLNVGYGYGLEFGKYKNLTCTFHEGATGAWKATVLRFPEYQISFVTLANTGKAVPATLTRQLADVVLGLKSDKQFFQTKPYSIGKYFAENEVLGTYLTPDDFAFIIFSDNGKLMLRRNGRNDVELVRESANVFHQKFDQDFKQEFTINSRGQQQLTAYYTSHAPYTLTRVPEIAKSYDYTQWNGEYVSEELSTGLSIRFLDASKYEVILHNKDTTSGILVSDIKMLVDSYSLDLGSGEILLNSDRAKRIRFRRKF